MWKHSSVSLTVNNTEVICGETCLNLYFQMKSHPRTVHVLSVPFPLNGVGPILPWMTHYSSTLFHVCCSLSGGQCVSSSQAETSRNFFSGCVCSRVGGCKVMDFTGQVLCLTPLKGASQSCPRVTLPVGLLQTNECNTEGKQVPTVLSLWVSATFLCI